MYGSVAEVAFSPDGAFMYVADNSNFCIWIACMKTWRVIGWFAGKPVEGSGNTPDTYYTPHRIVLDSEGNMLVARVAGGLERYIFEGVS
jgi:DNA-binding beta-propeller fold protein YncE